MKKVSTADVVTWIFLFIVWGAGTNSVGWLFTGQFWGESDAGWPFIVFAALWPVWIYGMWVGGRWFFVRRKWTDQQRAEHEARRLAKWERERNSELLKQKQEEIDRFGWAPQGQAVPSGLRPGVRARMPRDADDFESASAEWVQSCGVNARRTPKGPDGGLDLIGPSFAGQCKFHPSNKVGAPDVQQLAGAARQAQKTDMAFFHYGPGYTEAAIEAARSLGVQLWEMDVDRNTFRKVT